MLKLKIKLHKKTYLIAAGAVLVAAVVVGGIFAFKFLDRKHQEKLESTLVEATKSNSKKEFQNAIDKTTTQSGWSKDQTLRLDRILAESYYGLGDYKKSIDYYTKLKSAQTSDAVNSYYENIIGNVYRDSGDLDKAIELYNLAITHAPSSSNAWINLTYLYLSKDDLSKAKETIARAKEQNPKNSEIETISRVLAKRK